MIRYERNWNIPKTPFGVLCALWTLWDKRSTKTLLQFLTVAFRNISKFQIKVISSASWTGTNDNNDKLTDRHTGYGGRAYLNYDSNYHAIPSEYLWVAYPKYWKASAHTGIKADDLRDTIQHIRIWNSLQFSIHALAVSCSKHHLTIGYGRYKM